MVMISRRRLPLRANCGMSAKERRIKAMVRGLCTQIPARIAEDSTVGQASACRPSLASEGRQAVACPTVESSAILAGICVQSPRTIAFMRLSFADIPQLARNGNRLREIITILGRYGLADWLSHLDWRFVNSLI